MVCCFWAVIARGQAACSLPWTKMPSEAKTAAQLPLTFLPFCLALASKSHEGATQMQSGSSSLSALAQTPSVCVCLPGIVNAVRLIAETCRHSRLMTAQLSFPLIKQTSLTFAEGSRESALPESRK